MKETHGDPMYEQPCVQLAIASYVEGGPLMWTLPQHLQADDDDDDDNDDDD
jgi:hypothetical protein